MDKDKPPVLGGGHGGGGLPPYSSRYTGFSLQSCNLAMKRENSPSSSAAASAAIPDSGHGGDRFTHDISRMSDRPPRNAGHRRAQSEILSLPDDLSFDSDLGVVGSGGDGPSFSDDTEEDLFSMFLDMDKFASSSATSGLDLSGMAASTPPPMQVEVSMSGSAERPRIRHQHSQSVSIKPELFALSVEGPTLAETKKVLSAAKLADLAVVDPKRAKRIWANRQSAARSKERKIRYIAELERKVQTLQTEATTLSAQLTMLQRDTNSLVTENNELKLRLQSYEQKVHLQDALNDALRDEVQRLKVATGQATPNGGQLMNFGLTSFGGNQQFYHQNHPMQSLLAAHQLQQLQIHSQHQHQLPPHQHQQQQQPPSGPKPKEEVSSHIQRESTSNSNVAPKE